MGVSINGGTLKQMVYFMENPMKMDDFWVPLGRRGAATLQVSCRAFGALDVVGKSETCWENMGK